MYGKYLYYLTGKKINSLSEQLNYTVACNPIWLNINEMGGNIVQ